MRRFSLTPHPDTPRGEVDRIEVDVLRIGAADVSLTWRLVGALASIRIPDPVGMRRADELWRTTCFEAFMRPDDQPGYVEINLAPSEAWAAYAFEGYREGMRLAPGAPRMVQSNAGGDALEVQAVFDGLAPGATREWKIGLSAVVEHADGRISYWALHHAPGKPDFHHRAAFALTLPVPEPA